MDGIYSFDLVGDLKIFDKFHNLRDTSDKSVWAHYTFNLPRLTGASIMTLKADHFNSINFDQLLIRASATFAGRKYPWQYLTKTDIGNRDYVELNKIVLLQMNENSCGSLSHGIDDFYCRIFLVC